MSNGMVWKRSTTSGECEDVWDDRALIEAYDKAVQHVNQRIADKCLESNDNSVKSCVNPSNTKPISGHLWHLGQYCRCAYSEDGVEYEAQIISIDVSNDSCLVKYIGYGNEEQKSLQELKPSFGKRSRKQQIESLDTKDMKETDIQDINSNSDTDYENNSSSHQKHYNRHNHTMDSPQTSWFMPSNVNQKLIPANDPIVPPPLPLSADLMPDSEDESLASMLMSWYMSGYHTGYYKALKESRHNCNKCKK